MQINEYFATTEFAPLLGVKTQTVHKGYCLHGHYLNIRPIKLPNGRLLWPKAEVQVLLNGGAK